MPLIPFSHKYPDEFLSRTEDNLDVLVDKLRSFFEGTRKDIGDGKIPRRKLKKQFRYEEQLKDIKIDDAGISTNEVISEFNEMLEGTLRFQDPTTAFNMIPMPLLDVVAGLTLVNLYNVNPFWDFVSGKFCLFEKKIARMLGQLVEWPQADGVIVTGGKQALLYAIKNGIGRSSQNSDQPHDMNQYVVICSALAHFSVEHVCHYLGIRPENCIRIPAHASGEMDLNALETMMSRVIGEGKKIAAIMGVAGGTINLIPDAIGSIKQTIDRVVENHQLNYIPYFHVDSVISWPWLAFKNEFEDHPNAKIAKKIKHIVSQLSGIQYADSFAADFHKTGFCPYAAGIFVVKDSESLAGMTLDGSILKKDLHFGEGEMYRQTIENSRSGLSIAAIWIALRRMGLKGLRELLIYQLEVCEAFKQKIAEKYQDHFEVINDGHTHGWEIVFKPHFGDPLSWEQLLKASPDDQQEYIDSCQAFLNELWYGPMRDEETNYPVIGFVRKYSRVGSHEKSLPAFLIHPYSLHYDDEAVDEMLQGILQAKLAFEKKYVAAESSSVDEYLSQLIPPR